MEQNRYLKDVVQTNGCRTWINPQAGVDFNIPERQTEIFINDLPNDLFEIDILPHFERFGPVYQFRLLIDYDNRNRGFAYLIYFYEKSALECLDLMGYFVIKPGMMLDVEKSQERSHLLALNVPSILSDEEIERGFRSLYSQVSKVWVRREKQLKSETSTKTNCAAILGFADHETALTAKRWSGVGSVNVWDRNVKILWARVEQVEELKASGDEVKHVLVHNVPEDFDSDEFGGLMCTLVSPREVASIRPMRSDWLIEFASTHAASTIFQYFRGRRIEDQVLCTEWVTQDRLKAMSNFADFDFELRCFCLANYWDPPIFIYGRIFPFMNTQLCSVIIKNNRNNMFTTFFIEMNYDDLVDIHARVCELLMLVLMEMKELPKKNIVFKCTEGFATIVGAIFNMDNPKLIPASMTSHTPIFLFLDEVFALSKMSYELIASQMLDDVYKEYKFILNEKNLHHQWICGFISDSNMLGCIDPNYRHGKPLKFQMDSRHMILAMCNINSCSNIDLTDIPTKIKAESGKRTFRFKFDQLEMIPIASVQRDFVHFTFRPFIEFNFFDTFGPLRRFAPTIPTPQRPIYSVPRPFADTPSSSQQQNQRDTYCFMDFFNSLPI